MICVEMIRFWCKFCVVFVSRWSMKFRFLEMRRFYVKTDAVIFFMVDRFRGGVTEVIEKELYIGTGFE